MPTFSYIALKNNKDIVKGKVDAADARSAREAVKKMGLLPTRITDDSVNDKAAQQAAVKNIPLSKIRSFSLKDKIEFTQTLQILTSTGIPIIETLVFLENNAESKAIRSVAHELRRNIIVGGLTLAETLERHRKIFGRVFVGLVKAGEDSGELDKTLTRMLELLKKQDDIKSKVIGALVYPIFVILLACVVVTVMLVFVFPAFQDMFENLGRELPMMTQICMSLGLFIRKFWFVPIVFIVFLVLAVKHILANDVTKRPVDRFFLEIPLLSDLLKYANYSNFLAVLQVAYEAGIPIVDCLYLANMTLDNLVLKDAILAATAKVQQGVHLSVALRASNQIPNMMTFMIATGEQSGRLGELLHHCTTFIDQRLDGIIDKFTKLVEPAMLIFIGAIVLFLALSLYMPLFAAYG
ncbi:TPA: type II secretion system F family protein [Candidatus Galligastranaerophilus faecipullorum]|nr:type II secretion system F family protein [Candidatus Galligastranaerophilus faecipullorum]